MKLTFAFSPCPNDTFMFEPIVSGRIDTEGLRFEIHLADVEQLNNAAFSDQYDITKLSFNAYTGLTDTYQLLHAGSALGRNCGPILISKSPMTDEDVRHATVAIPGKNTTANFLLNYAYPDMKAGKEMIFSDVEDSILSGEVDAGVIIHESRFTFQEKGLVQIRDLGEYWESTTGSPIPLGGIVTRRRFTTELKQKINRVISRSVAYAQAHPDSGHTYIKEHAQEMDLDVMKSHINLYVNDYSANIGEEGKASIRHLFEHHPVAAKAGYTEPLFVPEEVTLPHSDFLTAAYWSSRYLNKMTGWDVGQITTPIKTYVDRLTDKDAKILIPGAGNAHEAEYLHRLGFANVFVCDLALHPLKNLQKRCPDFPTDHFIHGDFFDLEGSYDVIIEQTFFCALDPALRPAYVSKMADLLAPEGQLAGLLFGVDFPFSGPPFGGSQDEYHHLFSKHFSSLSIAACKNSIPPRMGSELFFIARH